MELRIERSITAEDVAATLAGLFNERGAPEYIRSDNGPEFVAKALKRWLESSGVGTLYIEPSEASSVAERLLGDVQQPLRGRAAKEGGVHQSV